MEKKTQMYNLSYFIGKQKIQTPCTNKTMGFCVMEREKLKKTGSFSKGKFRMTKV